MVFWGISFVWTENVFSYGYRPIMTVFFRLIISTGCLLLLNIWLKRLKKLKGKDLKMIVLLSFLQPFFYFIGESYGLLYASPTVAAVIISTIPLFSPIAAFYFFKERITLVNVAGIFVSIFGVILVILKPDLTFAAEPIGLICLAFAVATAVISSIILAKLSSRHNVYTIITYQNGLGVIWFLPAFLIVDLNQFIKLGFQWAPFVSIIELAIFASSVSYILFTYGVQKLGVTKANAFSNIIPAFTALFSFFILGERLTSINFIGILVVVAGLFMSQIKQTFFVRSKFIFFRAKKNGDVADF